MFAEIYVADIGAWTRFDRRRTRGVKFSPIWMDPKELLCLPADLSSELFIWVENVDRTVFNWGGRLDYTTKTWDKSHMNCGYFVQLSIVSERLMMPQDSEVEVS